MATPIDLCVQWVNLITGLPTIRREQLLASAARPTLPYCTVKIRSDAQYGLPTMRATDEAAPPPQDDLFIVRRQTLRQGILQVDAYGPGAADILRGLCLGLYEERSKEVWVGEETIVSDPVGSLLDLPELRGTTWEPHAQQDFLIRFNLTTEEALEDIQQGAFDTVFNT